jgi:hypothetical protein
MAAPLSAFIQSVRVSDLKITDRGTFTTSNRRNLNTANRLTAFAH